MEKRITAIIPGAGDEAEARDASIQPGTTVADLLRAAGRNPQEWGLQLRRGDNFLSLSGEEDLYWQVQDGEKVFLVLTNMDVG